MLKRIGILVGIASLALTAPASAVTIGVVGDSFSDEYGALDSGNPLLGYEGFSWVEILAITGRADFGSFDPTIGALGLPGGYAYNFALKGAGATDINVGDVTGLVPGANDIGQKFSEQIDDLAALIAGPTQIDAAVVHIGVNDIFSRMIQGGSFELADPGYLAFQTAFLTSLTGGLDTLQAAGSTPIVLALFGDGTATLQALQPVFGFSDDYIAAAVAGTLALNPLLEAEASARGIQVYDPFAAALAKFLRI